MDGRLLACCVFRPTQPPDVSRMVWWRSSRLHDLVWATSDIGPVRLTRAVACLHVAPMAMYGCLLNDRESNLPAVDCKYNRYTGHQGIWWRHDILRFTPYIFTSFFDSHVYCRLLAVKKRIITATWRSVLLSRATSWRKTLTSPQRRVNVLSYMLRLQYIVHCESKKVNRLVAKCYLSCIKFNYNLARLWAKREWAVFIEP